MPDLYRQVNPGSFSGSVCNFNNYRHWQLFKIYDRDDASLSFGVSNVRNGCIKLPDIHEPATPVPVKRLTCIIFYAMEKVVRSRMFKCPLMNVVTECTVKT